MRADRNRRMFAPVLILVLIAQTGCFPGYDPGTLIGGFFIGLGGEAINRRKLASPCKGQACDRERWLPIHVFSAGVSLGMRWQTCVRGFELDFASFDENPVVAASVNEHDDLRLATVTRNGFVYLSDFASSSADVQVDLNAVGVGWSNAGDLLAVVSRDPAGDKLLILDQELAQVLEFPLDLPEPPLDFQGKPPFDLRSTRFWVSWNPDDSLVAISTNFGPPAVIVGVPDGSSNAYDLLSVFFIGADVVVGEQQTGCFSECVFRFTIRNGQIVSQTHIPGPDDVLGSHPPTGVFLTREPDVPGLGIPFGDGGLRTVDTGPDIFGSGLSSDETVLLVPLDVALPALEATGFGPDDAVLPDPVTGGCPE